MEEKMLPENPMPAKSQGVKILVAAIIIIALVGIYLLAKGRTADSPTVQEGNAVSNQASMEQKNTDEEVFNLSAVPFEFSQKEIRVKKGDQVRINLTVTQGMHDWVVDEFQARTKQLKPGESDSIVFVADKAGTFEYYCSLFNHRQMGMIGKLIVE